MPGAVSNAVQSEPVATGGGLLGVVSAGLGLAISFGVDITGTQVAAIMLFLTVLVTWLVRAHVVPANVVDPAPMPPGNGGGAK